MSLFVRLNKFFYRLTAGKIGGNMGGATVLLLTTTGRKTGEPRTTPLRYLPHGSEYMVVASNYGQPKPPAWFYNLQANPTVTVQVMDKHFTARAEIIPDDQQPPLYQQFINADPRFIEYAKTAQPRIIPIIVLHPQP